LLLLLLLLPQFGVQCGNPLGTLPPPEVADRAQRRVLKEQTSEVRPANSKNSVLRRSKSFMTTTTQLMLLSEVMAVYRPIHT
jgi:hypothetical protein